MNPNRTALLIRCSVEEAQQIRAAARHQHRTVSGYILHCLQQKLEIEAAVQKKLASRSMLCLIDAIPNEPWFRRFLRCRKAHFSPSYTPERRVALAGVALPSTTSRTTTAECGTTTFTSTNWTSPCW